MPENTFFVQKPSGLPEFWQFVASGPRDLRLPQKMVSFHRNLALILIDDFLKTDPNF